MKSLTYVKTLPDEASMLEFAGFFAQACEDTAVIFLHGDLGAGKTTFARGFLRGLGFAGKVKSPTYTLVEPYTIAKRQVFHFDLYRCLDPEELMYIGIKDYFIPGAVCLVEWPELGAGYLPESDIDCFFSIKDQGRTLKIVSNTLLGKKIIERLGHDVS